jgi:hypothetical protein
MTTISGKVVMISSTALDLPEHREQARLACERAGFAPHDMMEHLTARNADAIEASLQMVEQADVYAGIFAQRYGYVPDGHNISITEMEYNRAVELKKPRLIFFNHDDHVFKSKDFETGPGAAKLQSLKERIGKDRVAAFFKSPDDLRSHVGEALTSLAREFDTPRRGRAGRGSLSSRAFQSNIPARRHLPFVGREKLLDSIHELLGDPSQDNVIVLRGPAGVGKSELAREYARRHCDQYPGGTFFINGRKDAVVSDLAQIGRTWLCLDFPHDFRLEDQALRTLRTLGEAQSLLLFDNVLAEDAIRPWLAPSGMPCHAVITSVVDCWDVGWMVMPIEPLSEAASLELIERIAGRELAARYGQRLARLAGGLPVQIVPASSIMRREARRGRIDSISLTLTQEAAQSFLGVYTQLEARGT